MGGYNCAFGQGKKTYEESLTQAPSSPIKNPEVDSRAHNHKNTNAPVKEEAKNAAKTYEKMAENVDKNKENPLGFDKDLI